MRSGNYLIGKDFSLKAFEMYVEPILNTNDLTVTDKIEITTSDLHKTVLVSISSKEKCFIDKLVNDSLLEAKNNIKADNNKIDEIHQRNNPQSKYLAWDHTIVKLDYSNPTKDNWITTGQFVKLDEYKNSKAASDAFPILSRIYLLNELELKTAKVKETLTNFLTSTVSQLR